MSERETAPWVKHALELGPVALFFVGYLLVRERTITLGGTEYTGFIVITALFVPLMAVSSFLLWRLTGKLSAMQILTLVLVVVFGGLTVWLNDERFFKMKPTLIYLTFAVILGVGLLRGQSYLRLLMKEMIPLDPEGWMILTRRFAALFFAMALANEIVWRMLSTDAWVNFKTFGLPLAIFAFFAFQSGLFARHGTGEDDTPDA